MYRKYVLRIVIVRIVVAVVIVIVAQLIRFPKEKKKAFLFFPFESGKT